MFSVSKARLVCKADNIYCNLWAHYLENVGRSTSHNPIGLNGLLME
jgi:hypothetical protein